MLKKDVKKSFLDRAIDIWNTLPEVVSKVSIVLGNKHSKSIILVSTDEET